MGSGACPPLAREGLNMQRLVGHPLPDIALGATNGGTVNLRDLPGASVIFCYPWTGRPGHPNPPNWDTIEGAHGSTPQAQAYADLYPLFCKQGIGILGLSIQDTDYQREFALRMGLPFPLLSDVRMAFSNALGLPTFATGGVSYLRRLTIIASAGIIQHVRYPVSPPEHDASDTLLYFQPI